MKKAASALAILLATSSIAEAQVDAVVGQWLDLASGSMMDFTEDGRFRSNVLPTPEARPTDRYAWGLDPAAGANVILIEFRDPVRPARTYRCQFQTLNATLILSPVGFGDGQTCPFAPFSWIR